RGHCSVDPAGQPAASNPIFMAAKRAGPRGGVTTIDGPDGRTLLAAFHSMTTPPLVVAVALDRFEALQEYRRQIAGAALFFVILLTTLGATLLVLFRQMDARASVEGVLARAQQIEAERLREANEHLEAANRLKDQ